MINQLIFKSITCSVRVYKFFFKFKMATFKTEVKFMVESKNRNLVKNVKVVQKEEVVQQH